MALSTDITGFYGYSIVALFGNLGYKFNITEVMEKIVDAFNLIMVYRDELIANCRLARQVLCDCSDIDTELVNLH